MEIIQNKKTKKITAIAILMIMLFSIITPVFAATGKVKLYNEKMTVTVGDKKRINVSINTTGEDLYWSGQGKIVGEFSGTSKYLNFKALKEGTQTIKAATKDGTVSASCVVTVVAKGGNAGGSNAGGSNAGGSNAGGSNAGGSNAGEAISGLVTGIGGAVTGIIESGALEKIFNVIMQVIMKIIEALGNMFTEVPEIELPEQEEPATDEPAKEGTLTLNKKTAELKVDETLQLTAKVDGEKINATYTSNNNSAASVDKNGKVTAKAVGDATITATYNGKTATCKVTVKAKGGNTGGGSTGGGSSSTTKITTTSVIKTDNANAFPALSRDDLLYIIENATITSTDKRRDNLKAQLDNFMYIQNNNKVNALFAIAVSIEESGAGTSKRAKNINNWFGIKGSPSDSSGYKKYDSAGDSIKHFGKLISGSTYFGAGKITPGAIGPVYCEGNAWGGTITSHMNSLYKTLNK